MTIRARFHSKAVFAVALAVFALLASRAGFAARPAPPALSLTPNWTTDGNRIGAAFGNSVGTAGDQDGDGRSDILTTAPGLSDLFSGQPCGFAYSPTFGWQVWGGSHCAAVIADAGDVNGDGRRDVITGVVAEDKRVEIYYGPVGGTDLVADWIVRSADPDDSFGAAVAGAGDVNGDGFDDVIVGAPGSGVGGRAFVYLGSSSGPSTEPIVLESTWQNSNLGASTAGAGDVNGDGYHDVIVGAPYYYTPQNYGAAFVFLGSAGGLSTTPAWSSSVSQPNATTGQAVASAGDVNGDGFGDVIVGDGSYRNPARASEGHAAVFLGSATGLATTPAWSEYGGMKYGNFGRAVATAGDINCDGFADVIVGAPAGFSSSGNIADRALAYLGSAAGLNTRAAWTVSMLQNGSYQGFGFSVSSAGDLNGDGSDDVVVGAPSFTDDQFVEGRVFVFASTQGCVN